MAPVARSAKRMRPCPCRNGFEQLRTGTRNIKHLHMVIPCQPHQQVFVIGRTKHIGRHLARFGSPFHGLCGQVNRHQFITVLHRGVSRGAFRVNPNVTGRFA